MKRFHLFILVVTMLFAGRHAIFAQATNTAYYAAELEQGEIKELLKRFRIDPMNLSTEEASKLYYGYATSPHFEGDINTALYEVSKLLSAKDFKDDLHCSVAEYQSRGLYGSKRHKDHRQTLFRLQSGCCCHKGAHCPAGTEQGDFACGIQIEQYEKQIAENHP